MIDRKIVKDIENTLKIYPFLVISSKNQQNTKSSTLNFGINGKYKRIVDNINEAIELLPRNEKKFLELRYFKGWSIVKIAIEMNYSEQMLFRIRKSLIKKMYFALHPFITDGIGQLEQSKRMSVDVKKMYLINYNMYVS